MNGVIPVIDLFAGAGGLSEGFSRQRWNGVHSFDVKLAIDRETAAVNTLTLRAFYHQFRHTEVPEAYYRYLRGQAERQSIAEQYPAEWREAEQRCIQADLAGMPKKRLGKLINQAIAGRSDWVLIGGPPCRPYSTIGRARSREQKGYNAAAGPELELYREFLKAIAGHWPAVFLMENVRGLLSASCQGQPIFPELLKSLEQPDGQGATPEKRYRLYSVTSADQRQVDRRSCHRAGDNFLVKAENYGIPQARHRIIIIGVRADISEASEPLAGSPKICSSQVLNGLPPVRSGLSRADDPEDWLDAIKEIPSQPWWADLEPAVRERIRRQLKTLSIPEAGRGNSFLNQQATCKVLKDWFLDERISGTIQHHARTHRRDDLWRYLFAACAVQETGRPFRVRDFPAGLRPQHKNIEAALNDGRFADRFCVVPEHAPSRTVMSHIRKDGHYYIHYDPAQCRSLTVREAARLQTFPDNYFFEGNRTEQYQQIGNAVPPLLSYQIAGRIADLLERRRNG